MADPIRGEVWLADLNPIRGHEQAGTRPVLILSDDRFNRSGAGLVFGVPLSSRDRGIPYHVRLDPPEGGLRRTSFAMCEQTRSLSKDRLRERWGIVTPATMDEVSYLVRVLLAL